MPRRIVPDIIDGQHLSALAKDATVCDAAKAMAERGIGAVLVTNDGRLEGIFTERDMTIRIVAKGLDPRTTRLADVMTRNPDTLAPTDTPASALERMRKHGYRHLPVVDGTKVVGMVSIRDLYADVKNELEDGIRSRDAFIFGNSYGGVS